MRYVKFTRKILWLIVLGVVFCYADAPLENVPPIISSSGGGNYNVKQQYNYFFRGESVRQILQKFAQDNGIRIEISPRINSKNMNHSVSGRFTSSQENGILDILGRQYGFNWFIFSGNLYIVDNQRYTKSIEVTAQDMPSIKGNLQQLGLLNAKFGYAELPYENKVIISGPKEYVELVAQQIKELDIPPNAQQFAIYHLKYASATDVTINLSGQQLVIPGVATILQAILQGNRSGVSSVNRLVNQTIEPIQNQINQVLSQTGGDKAVTKDDTSQVTGIVSNALVQADRRYNTVIIRDKKANLDIYRNLIALLDVPSPIIQVDVLIIRINEDRLEQMGINWWGSYNGVGLGIGAANLAQANPGNNLSFYYGQISPGSVLINNVNNFMAGLQFLQQNSLAKAEGHPSIATVDNIPAIISVNETTYLNTPSTTSATNTTSTTTSSNGSSYSQAQLTTSLQITPHVIFDENNKSQIKLSIVLQDGFVSDPAISLYPTITQGTITSQAVINEGQSILLAGYSNNKTERVENKVPGLGDIPLLGWFFKSSSLKVQKQATIYLVTPKIMWQKDAYKIKDYVTLQGNSFDVKDSIQTVVHTAESSTGKTIDNSVFNFPGLNMNNAKESTTPNKVLKSSSSSNVAASGTLPAAVIKETTVSANKQQGINTTMTNAPTKSERVDTKSESSARAMSNIVESWPEIMM